MLLWQPDARGMPRRTLCHDHWARAGPLSGIVDQEIVWSGNILVGEKTEGEFSGLVILRTSSDDFERELPFRGRSPHAGIPACSFADRRQTVSSADSGAIRPLC